MHDSHRLAMAIWSINHFKILPNYKIEVSFADGTSGIADLAPRLSQGPVLRKNPSQVAQTITRPQPRMNTRDGGLPRPDRRAPHRTLRVDAVNSVGPSASTEDPESPAPASYAAVLDCNAAPKNEGSSVGELPTEELANPNTPDESSRSPVRTPHSSADCAVPTSIPSSPKRRSTDPAQLRRCYRDHEVEIDAGFPTRPPPAAAAVSTRHSDV
jgi:hypothetical protein